MYSAGVPRLWNQTIEAHRRDVRVAILESTAALVGEHGLLSVTMSRVAAETGIGRATLYKYFPDVESILHAWHERHITEHLARLNAIRDRGADAAERLEAAMQAYADICHYRGRHGTEELGALLHRSEHAASAQQQLHDVFRDLLAEAVADGGIRGDTPPEELATYCLHALSAARALQSDASVRRLVAIILTALRAQP